MSLLRVSLFVSAVALISATPVRAAINPNYLVSDVDMEYVDAMSLADIQVFLDQRGALGTRFMDDADGITKTAAEIIWRVSQQYRLSPRFLLALLQREQSLVEAKSINQRQLDWALGYAVCDDCDREHPLVAAYRGFGKQMEGAASRIREFYLRDLASVGKTQTGHGPGITKIIDGTPVTPQNNATAVLYTYTPHLNGNLNFARIWKKWFSREIPDGTVVRTEDGLHWLIQNGERRQFSSVSVLASRARVQDVVTLPLSVIEDYVLGNDIRYANYSLLQGPDATNYLLDGDTVRPIASEEVFRKIGFNPLEVEEITADELAFFSVGTPITTATLYPTGALLQHNKTGGVYWVKDGVKYPIPGKEIMAVRFPKKKLTAVGESTLETFTSGSPLLFPDATLIMGTDDPTVYVVSNGQRRPIASEDVFHTMGWSFKNVQRTTAAILNLHPLGPPIDISKDELPVQVAGQEL